MNRITIADRMKEYRQNHNVTQKDFAKLIGISPQAISKWEREQGYPDISLLPVLANLLRCSVNDFFEVE